VTAVSYDEALAALEARLGKKAAKHCKRVSEAAVVLALAYGVDLDLARLAGLLHDWDREQSADELLAAAKAAGIEITPADAVTPHLLHARTGAVAARVALPGLPDEAVNAISRHTVGAVGMSDLDMVVYMADMIESHRDYLGVDELRDAVGVVSLAEVFALGYRQSVRHLVEARKLIHPVTIDVWNEHVAGEPR
jgi:predicted HD superfamily hydrolase involved in NAD metabolism